ncbi:MAG: Lactose transport system permease protein LacF [Chloroflexi bacterium ADurb.Bin325]|nr:MAG: Lactose transport system permease protein LacF [Chloroflexi bacterium ADurb.Bin325]
MIATRRSPAQAGAKSQSNRIRLAGQRGMIALAVLPLAVFYLVWVGIPMIYTFIMSFYDWNPLSVTQTFVGAGNYLEALTRDPLFKRVLINTAYYTVVTVPIGLILALVVAVMVNSLPRFIGLFRAIYFLPVVTSVVATSIIWRWLYQSRFGLINQLIGMVLVDTLHLPINPSIPWLTSRTLAMPAVMAMSIWKGLGFTMVLFLAGLTSIPSVYYEAAKIDGAGVWQLFRHITIPLLQPTMIFVLATGIIGGMQVFAPMYVMTQGGPANMTKPFVYHLYEKAFTLYRFGYASSLAFILFAIIMFFVFLQFQVMKTRWEY